jgi:hypothetical protein
MSNQRRYAIKGLNHNPFLTGLLPQEIFTLTCFIFFISSMPTPSYQASRRTVCVTRAGVGDGTPSDWKKAEA